MGTLCGGNKRLICWPRCFVSFGCGLLVKTLTLVDVFGAGSEPRLSLLLLGGGRLVKTYKRSRLDVVGSESRHDYGGIYQPSPGLRPCVSNVPAASVLSSQPASSHRS